MARTKQNGGKSWTYSEIQYLKENWGDVSIKGIAQKLKRTVNAVKLKSQRIGLGRMTEYGEYITYNQLMYLIQGAQFGRDDKRLLNAGFPVQYQMIISKKIKIVYMDKFWKWFKENKHAISIKNTQKGDFGYEPEWVEEKRKADKLAAQYKVTPWTQYEDDRLLSLLKEFKYGYREISIKLKRSEGAIKRRMLDLKIKMRPLRADNHNPWSESEIQKVKDLYLKGYKSCIIAEYIENRSALAINGLLERHNYFKGVKDVRNK